MSEAQVLPLAVCVLFLGLIVLLLQPRRDSAAVFIPGCRRPAGEMGHMGRRGRRKRSPLWSRPKWGRRQRAASESGAPDAATLLEFTAAMLRAGVGIEACLHRLSQDVPQAQPLAQVHRALTAGQSWDDAWGSVQQRPELSSFGRELAFAYSTGAPTVELLELTAAQARRSRRALLEEQAAKLGVKIVLPLGLCFLPAFILLGVIPVVLGLLQELA